MDKSIRTDVPVVPALLEVKQPACARPLKDKMTQ